MQELVNGALATLGVPDGPPDAALTLDSLQVVALVDLLEDAVPGLYLTGEDVTREAFASRAALVALLERKERA